MATVTKIRIDIKETNGSTINQFYETFGYGATGFDENRVKAWLCEQLAKDKLSPRSLKSILRIMELVQNNCSIEVKIKDYLDFKMTPE